MSDIPARQQQSESVLELVPDKEKMTQEDVKNLGKPIAGAPDLSEFTYVCPECKRQEPPLESIVEIIDKPELIAFAKPYFDKSGKYTAGKKKFLVPTRCFPYGHARLLTWDVDFIYDLGM